MAYDPEDTTDLLPAIQPMSGHHQAPDQHPPACIQVGPIQRLDAEVREVRKRVESQGRDSVRLDAAIESLASTCQRLERVVETLSQARRGIGEQILAAVIHWGVPVVAAAVIWLIAASGQVAHVRAAVAP